MIPPKSVIPGDIKKIKNTKHKTKLKSKPKVKLNWIGDPEDGPYGLIASFWTIFTKPMENKKNG